ncbi:MAG: hypothetical protein COW50_02645 [Candidatus Moranbacteria bacterium CG17_big_fil_post_rev_8_21_14_2_50_41_107]|nr:MAG: hypothetical protein COW50_02645 [Candidatus Moranbacteria bacterium CG17_big_fil_post_rev_8_21_14_2_50_41_107]
MSMEYDPILYEADQRSFLKEEVEFYKNICAKFDSKIILELGVGTGRIFSKLLPMVDYAVGLDISESMLDVCNKRCKPNINYKLYEKSFVRFNLDTIFDLIYIPFNTFQHLLLEEDQISCLESVRVHMHKNSRFILDLMNLGNLTFDFDNWKLDYSSVLEDGRIIEREQKTMSIDKKTSIVSKVFLYKEIIDGKTEKTHEFKALMKITPNEEMRKLLVRSGFEIEDVWSDYLFGHDSNTKKMIYCLKRYEF